MSCSMHTWSTWYHICLIELTVIYTFINFFQFNLYNHLSIHQCIHLSSTYPFIHWSIHSLIYSFLLFLSISSNSPPSQQIHIIQLLWQLWSGIPKYGHKASQYMDLLGYCSSSLCSSQMYIICLNERRKNIESVFACVMNILHTHTQTLSLPESNCTVNTPSTLS